MYGPKERPRRFSPKGLHLYGGLVKPLPLFQRPQRGVGIVEVGVLPIAQVKFEVLTTEECPLGCGGAVYYDDEGQRFCTLCADKWRMV